MARLGLGPAATLRVAPTERLKGRLHAQRPGLGRGAGRHLPKVLRRPSFRAPDAQPSVPADPSSGRADVGPPSRVRVAACPRPAHACSCSTATRWPTARSSRSRSRTSRPTTGQHTNAVYGFTSMLINVLRDEQPTHVGVAFDKSRQTFRLAGVRRLQGGPQQDAHGVLLPAAADPGGARRAPHPAPGAGGLRGRRHHRHARHRGGARGPRGADPHRRPRLAPAGDRDLHRALPHARRLRAGPDDARTPSRPSTACRPRATPSSPRWWGRPPTTCPASPASARATPRSGSTSTTGSTTSSTTPTRSPARRARRCAPTSPT